MPVVKFNVGDLEALLGKAVSRDELRDTIPMIGADLDDVSGDDWAVEFFPDRPDLFTVEGIARALRAYLGVEPGIRRYDVAEATASLAVEGSVAGVRPHIVAAIVRGVDMTEARLKGLIDLQEDLHWGLGARRRKVAIGVHDLAPIQGPYVYKAVAPDAISFVPLQSEEEMTLQEVLERHPKGRDYAHLVEGHDRYPVILDAEGQLLSFPPVINGRLTTVTTDSRDLFIDVTGWDAWAVEKALNLVTTSLAESGATVEAVDIEGGHKARTPDLEPTARDLDPAAVARLLGVDLDAAAVAERLRRMGYGAAPQGDGVRVEVPAYRVDILHDVDLMEDVAIGHGYANFESERPGVTTYGSQLAGSVVSERVRSSLTGLGFLEAMTLSLSNDADQFEKMGAEPGWAVRVKNPITEDHTLMRVRLLPSLMNILKKNAHRDLPQRVFEVGVVTAEGDGGQPAPQRRVAGAVIAGKVGFTDAKGWVQALARDLQWSYDVEPADHPAYVPGRCARLVVEGEALGEFGEVHPRTIAAFGLGHPVVAFDLALPE